jgi:ParB family chromosome partitioning protein
MVRSIKEMGILLPIIVRPILNNDPILQYEILSGHNRVESAKLAGLTEIPAIIKTDLSDEEAQLIVTETNLIQRSFADLKHSERAVALKIHLDALKKTHGGQGKRNDLLDEIEKLSNPDKIMEYSTSGILDRKSDSREKVAEKYDLSPRSVSRYIRLYNLEKSLLDKVDEDKIGIYPAESISYLLPDEQAEVNRILDETNYKIDMKKAESLRELSESKKLTPKIIENILSGIMIKKKNRASLPVPSLKLKGKILSKYFKPGDKPEDIEAEIVKALEYYRAHIEENNKAGIPVYNRDS